MFALTCDFNENLWECLICWIWTVIKSNRKRLQLAQAHELHHILSTTCQSREHWETSRDWKSKQTLNCSVPFCVKFFADGDEDLGTWHMVSNWHLTRIVNNYCPTDALNPDKHRIETLSQWDYWGCYAKLVHQCDWAIKYHFFCVGFENWINSPILSNCG